MSKKKFQVIVADCPWPFGDSLKMSEVKRGAEANYCTMTVDRIKNMPVKDISDPNGAILALWVPSSLLQEGLDTMKAWGFTHKQTYVWVKTKKSNFDNFKKWVTKNYLKKSALAYDKNFFIKNVKEILTAMSSLDLNNMLAFGMGRLFRQTHELCLIGINNKKIYRNLQNKSQRSVSFDVNLKHSAKPEHLQDSLEHMFPGAQKIELFARRKRDGWECYGNEICGGEDIYDSLAKLM